MSIDGTIALSVGTWKFCGCFRDFQVYFFFFCNLLSTKPYKDVIQELLVFKIAHLLLLCY